ncbi:glycerol-3-phosphate responsive antiterminator, partial [Escherichia coli]|uniref:glycerol-3-phosphate responsive antiterminator n=1 Tax=Escherichia coli TaxID=562 RepID=UPI000AEEDD9A
MPLLHLLRQNPVIAAVKDNASLQLAIDSECQFISVLYGNICTISNIVKKIGNDSNLLIVFYVQIMPDD